MSATMGSGNTLAKNAIQSGTFPTLHKYIFFLLGVSCLLQKKAVTCYYTKKLSCFLNISKHKDNRLFSSDLAVEGTLSGRLTQFFKAG